MKFTLLVENYSQSETGRGSLFVTGKDTGIGIRTEQIPHLFQRFHKQRDHLTAHTKVVV